MLFWFLGLSIINQYNLTWSFIEKICKEAFSSVWMNRHRQNPRFGSRLSVFDFSGGILLKACFLWSVLGDTGPMILYWLCTDAGCTTWIYLFNSACTYSCPLRKKKTSLFGAFFFFYERDVCAWVNQIKLRKLVILGCPTYLLTNFQQ